MTALLTIPAELRGRLQWVAYALEERDGKMTKIPKNPRTGANASSTAPSTWATFAEARTSVTRFGLAGVGYVFDENDSYVGVDLDKCRDPQTGELEDWAQEIVNHLCSYSEVSQSGTGLHVIVTGNLSDGWRKCGSVEMYSAGRFFVMTGDHLDGSPETIEERTEALTELQARYARPIPEVRPVPPSPTLADRELLDKAFRAKNGAKIEALYQGDTSSYPSASEADLALCSMLAFYTQDPAQLDRLFQTSGLYRPKWAEPHGAQTYGQLTVARALAGQTATYSRNGHSAAATPGGHDVGQVGDITAVGDAPTFHKTDAGNAELFAHLNGDRLRYDHRRRRWLRWDGNRWQPDADGEVCRLAKAAARQRFAAAVDISDTEDRKRVANWAIASESRARLDAALALAQSEPPIADAGEGWDADAWLMGVANGVLDLRTGQLRPGEQADRITMTTGIPYDPAAECPRWERFVSEVFGGDPDLADYFQRAAGYSLSGSTREQCFFIGYGAGLNGKTTALRVLREIVGDYGGNTPFTTLEAAGRASINNDLAALAGKRLVTASELNESARLNEARLKMLAGSDPVTARFLYSESFTFTSAAKLWLAVNHKPLVRDDSVGFWRKVHLIPFTVSFKGRADSELETTLRAEYPGILAWAVRGCLAWQERGLAPAQSVAAATAEYQAESDPLGAFLDDACTLDQSAIVRANALFRAYSSWATDAGLKDRDVLPANRFGSICAARFARRKDRQGWLYVGVALNAEVSP